jgi:hypothetical protein
MPRRTFRTFARAAVVFALTCTAAFAQKTINIPADQPTIQAGINAASNGDTVLVAPGTYHEHIDFKGKIITVTSSNGPSKTIIDGDHTPGMPTVFIHQKEPLATILSNFTIRGGGDNIFAGQGDGGIEIGNYATPTIRDNIVTSNFCHGINVSFATPAILHNQVTGTTSSVGGGPQSYCIFQSAIGLLGDGGLRPGALVQGNIIDGNAGGAINIWAAQNPLILDNIVRNNSSGGPGTFVVSANSTGMVIAQNLVYDNTSGCAATLALDEGYLGPGPSSIVINNTFVDNTIGGTGGGSECNNSAQVYPGPYGYGSSGPSWIIANNIFSGNTNYPAVQCNELSSLPAPLESDQPVFDHNIVWNSSGLFFNKTCVDVSSRYGNIAADPQFVNAAGNDFHLRVTSPAIDAGNNSALQDYLSLRGPILSTDFDGNPRIADTTARGYANVDIGAYEYAGNTAVQPTSVVVTSNNYSGQADTTYVFTATLTSPYGIPTGSVDFYLDGTRIGTSVINGGVATLSNFLIHPGVHNVIATYAGQGAFTPAVSVVIILGIDKYGTKATLTSTPNPSLFGQNVIFNLNILSSEPGFTPSPVLLVDQSTNQTLATLTPDSAGNATFSTSSLAIGFHNIAATYAGDAQHASTSVTIYQQVINGYATSTTLASSFNPSVIGQTVTFTSAVTSTNGTPTGSIQFSDGATVLATQPLSATGAATFATSALTVGVHTITATYLATGTFAGSSASLSQTVQSGYPTTTTITSSLNPSTVGQSVTFTVHVSSANGVPVGFFAISDSASRIGALVPVDVNGNGSWTPATLARGTHTITATFNPDVGFAVSIGTLLQQVDGLADTVVLTATPTTATLGSSIALTATVTASGAPTGTVTFFSNAIILGSAPLVNGIATLPTATLTVGANSIRAVYSGDTTYNIANSNSITVTITITVQPTTLTLASSAPTSPALVPVTFTAQLFANAGPATITGVPIIFTIDGKIAATVSTANQGVATLTTFALSPGTHTITVSFAGDLTHSPSAAAPLTESVTPDATVTTVLPPLGTITQLDRVSPLAVVRSNYLSAVPTGSVTIFEGTTALATATLTPTTSLISNASILLNPLAPGTHILVAVYTPDTASFLPSQSIPFTLIVIPASFTLTLSDPTLTIQTGHHHTETVSLTSIGGLTGAFTLSCGPRPDYTTCAWSQTSVTLPANGTVSTSLIIDTNQLPGFLSSTSVPSPTTKAGAPFTARFLRDGWAGTTFACLLPLTLLTLRRRSNLRSLLSLLLLAALATTVTACGANKYPYSTAPGTYVIPITATGPPVPGGVSPTQTVNLKLIVTE